MTGRAVAVQLDDRSAVPGLGLAEYEPLGLDRGRRPGDGSKFSHADQPVGRLGSDQDSRTDQATGPGPTLTNGAAQSRSDPSASDQAWPKANGMFLSTYDVIENLYGPAYGPGGRDDGEPSALAACAGVRVGHPGPSPAPSMKCPHPTSIVMCVTRSAQSRRTAWSRGAVATSSSPHTTTSA